MEVEEKPFHLPLKNIHINQRFGDNRACIALDGSNHVITCDGNNPPRGYRSVYGPKGHLGIDFRARNGEEVYNSRGGEVIFVDTQPRTGLDVRVLSKVGEQWYIHLYEHLLGYKPQVGQFIPTGSLIGWADNTGFSSADHLHFEIKELTEAEVELIREDVDKHIRTVGTSVNPETLLSDTCALDVLNSRDYMLEQLSKTLDKLGDTLRSLIIYLNSRQHGIK